MIIIDILYSLIIKPLILIFDLIYSFSYKKTQYIGISILVLSLVVNIFVLPLYIRADAIQLEENKKRKKMSKWENHIKKSFKGDERFMMLQTFYKQNDYKPYQTLKSALPLFLEIPFFIAAYIYLSHLNLLNGASFGVISDLAVPDGLLPILGFRINVLPIIMTIINIISSLVYNRSSNLKDKIQLFIIAFVFLILLYDSPSGLVLYWMFNNIFSLIKNAVFSIIENKHKENKFDEEKVSQPFDKPLFIIFSCSSLLLVMLISSYIPTVLINSSIEEFISFNTMKNPAIYIINNLLVGVGLLFVWPNVFYFFSKTKGKRILTELLLVLCVVSFLNYSSIPFDSSMSMFLVIEKHTQATRTLALRCIVIFVAAVVLCHLILSYKKKTASFIILFAMISFAFINGFLLFNTYVKGNNELSRISSYENYPEIHLSKNGKNVVVIMMDRMVSYYIPYIMNEKPELIDGFDGFIYYPNCTSFGTATNGGSPGIFGGYEYVPEEMNKRNTESLKDKQNESLKVMPVLFLNNGYDVTVGNPTYANYKWIPDLSIYNDYPQIYTYNTCGKLNPKDAYYCYDEVMNRNLIFYGIYRCSPVFFNKLVYDDGFYGSITNSFVSGIGMCCYSSVSTGYGIGETFLNSYMELIGLPDNSIIKNDNSNNFNLLCNNTTHESSIMKEPDYSLDYSVDNTEYDYNHPYRYSFEGDELKLYEYTKSKIDGDDYKESGVDTERVMLYQSDMVSMLRLSEWFSFLKENDVYDNTRIIIVSDHSSSLRWDSELIMGLKYEDGTKKYYDLLSAQSTLLVKDFNAHGFGIDDSFMTNADVPSIATESIINNPKNPFSGKPINNEAKQNEVKIMVSNEWKTDDNNGNTFKKTQWFSVKDNIFESDNWKYVGTY